MSLVSGSIVEKPFLQSPDTSGKQSTTFHKMNLQITIDIRKKSLCSESQQ
jgi:hypothetical protein